MLRTIKNILLCGSSVDVIVYSPNSPLGDLSYREIAFQWKGVEYAINFFLVRNAREPIELGKEPCRIVESRVYVRDFRLETLFNCLEYMLVHDLLGQTFQALGPVDTDSVWVGVPPNPLNIDDPEKQARALQKVRHHLLLALQCAVTFNLASLREDELLQWLQEECRGIIHMYDAYEERM
ncbi:MAG: hypothetical protein F9B45_32335 [Phycisphaera sp. RhM]|nr:hypothetical protein [Phycisphaera sp. RhM]